MMRFAKSLELLLVVFQPIQPKSDNVSIGIAQAQHRLLARNLNSIAALSIILATALVVSLIRHQPPLIPFLWFGLTLPIPIGQFLIAHRRRSRKTKPQTNARPFRWDLLQAAERSILYSAVIWGFVAVLFGNPNMEALYFTTLIQVSMCTGLGMMIAPLPRLVMRFTIVSLVPLAFVLAAQGTTFGITLALLIFVLIGAIFKGSMTSYHQLRRIVGSETKTQQTESILRSTLEAMPDAVALFDTHGKLLLTNENYETWDVPNVAPATLEGEETRTPGENKWFHHKWLDIPDIGTLSLHSDISIQKERENALIAAMQAAEVANGARARFLSRMSHELRTPLNCILGFSSILTEGGPQPSSVVKEYAEFIRDSGDQLLAMIEDVIDYSKVGTETLNKDASAIDVRAAILAAIEKAKKKPGCQAEMSYKIRIGQGAETLVAHFTIIDRILTALISNAIKFSPEAADIIITSRLGPDNRLSIIVRDFGKGMSQEEVTDAFSVFYQADETRKRAQDGAGLGLALVRKLTIQANAKIKVMSEPGRGTAVILMFEEPIADVRSKLTA